MAAQYDFRRWLKSLNGRSSAEMFTEGTRACGEAILSLFGDGAGCRAGQVPGAM